MIQSLKQTFNNKDYEFFDGGQPYNLNIFGVRSPILKVNQFDDFIYCVYRDDNLNWVIKQWEATTDPGLSYMYSPLNVRGTAILKPGQYRGAYAIDKHQGRYEALCQRLAPVVVYRDRDRDNYMDYKRPEKGMFGINIHKAGRDSSLVNKWSAGCQVFKRSSDFDDFMDLVKRSASIYGNRFTYTLLDDTV